MGSLKITYIRSAIGQRPNQKATVRALGFRRLQETIIRPDSPQVRGMVRRVRHLVKVEEQA